MNWHLRKSIRTGPVRWNLSKSGIGMSVGVRGLRVGTGPRGSYIAGGRRGLYFRQSLGQTSTGRGTTHSRYPNVTPQAVPVSPVLQGAPIQYLPETQVNASIPASADTLAHYIATQRAHHSLFWWSVSGLILLNLVILSLVWQIGLATLVISIVFAYYIKRWDRERTHVVLHYELDPSEQASYQQLCSGLQWLASSTRLLRVDAQQVHGDWKRNAGTTTALHLTHAVVLPPGNLPWLETNVPVWSLRWRQGHLALIFLPDRLLIEQGRATASLSYAQAQVTTALGRFVESRSVHLTPPSLRGLGNM